MLDFGFARNDTDRITPNSRQNTMTHATTVVRCCKVAWCVSILRSVLAYFKGLLGLKYIYWRRSGTLRCAWAIDDKYFYRPSSFWRTFVVRWWPWFRRAPTAAAVSVWPQLTGMSKGLSVIIVCS